MRAALLLSLFLGIDVSILLYETSQLSVAYSELQLLGGNFSAVKFLVNTSLAFFGKNDYALRVPMILLHVMNVLLFYRLSTKYLKRENDVLWVTAIFILLPGVMSSAIVVNGAGFVIFGLLLYLNLYDKSPYFKYLLPIILLFCERSFMFLYAGLFFYAVSQKEKRFAAFSAALFVLSLYVYGFDTQGLPKGHFLDTLAVYAAIFTPIVFVYIFYILYRRYITSKEDILWYLAATAFLLSLLLSFRQKLHLERFAPYLIIALPIAAQTFFTSYRVRLRQFRTRYKILFFTAFAFLLLNATAVVFNKYLYRFVKNPKEQFAYNMQIAKDLAYKLHTMHILCAKIENHEMQARLRFYNISSCESVLLTKTYRKHAQKVTISYKDKPVYSIYVTKINK
jgi:hypothetical protein